MKVFSDECPFTIDKFHNSRNDCYIASEPQELVPVVTSKKPASVMVLVVICSNGKVMPPHFFQPGTKINAEAYQEVLETAVLPWLKDQCPQGNFVWQRDSAHAHTA